MVLARKPKSFPTFSKANIKMTVSSDKNHPDAIQIERGSAKAKVNLFFWSGTTKTTYTHTNSCTKVVNLWLEQFLFLFFVVYCFIFALYTLILCRIIGTVSNVNTMLKIPKSLIYHISSEQQQRFLTSSCVCICVCFCDIYRLFLGFYVILCRGNEKSSSNVLNCSANRKGTGNGVPILFAFIFRFSSMNLCTRHDVATITIL